jgi:hypothetical protein
MVSQFVRLESHRHHSGVNHFKTTKPVVIVLPFLLSSIAAIGSQFSATVAEDEGAGGLIEDITHRKVPIRYACLLILLVTVMITWETDVNQIIA